MSAAAPRALALANNDVALVVWQYSAKLPGCLGFCVQRQVAGSAAWVPLPSWVGFAGQDNPNWTARTTAEWPVQGYEWKDLTAPRGGTYRYRIVPLTGQPGAAPLTPLDDQAVETAAVTLTSDCGGGLHATFNRGILSTQFLARALAATPGTSLLAHIGTPGDPIRADLAGDMPQALGMLLRRVATAGGTCYLALYELTDPEMLALLLATPALHLILSNTGEDDTENAPARTKLHAAAAASGGKVEVLDRFVPSGHIGHNKFCIWADPSGAAQAVLLGSTNWTDTALCGQSNNALVVENPEIAAAYLAYWHRLKEDTPASGTAPQGPALRGADAAPGAKDVALDGGQVTVWFSPNTPHARATHPDGAELVPPDLGQVFALMRAARQAILFLEFEPGTPSVVDCAAACSNANPALFVRGAVTDPGAASAYATALVHRRADDAVTVVPATAIGDRFESWQHEMLKTPGGHAIIHDKIVVIDPMSPDCVVITGSHNQGYRASYNNDENLLIVRGHAGLARAYAAHVMDVYDHYRFRYEVLKTPQQAFSSLVRDDTWQDRSFDPDHPASGDAAVWFPDAAPAVQAPAAAETVPAAAAGATPAAADVRIRPPSVNGYAAAGGPRLADFLDGLPIRTRWLAGHQVVWQTGQQDGPDGDGPDDHTHCSAFLAAAAQDLGIYVLRPPDHPQQLLADAQVAWLSGGKSGESWGAAPSAAASGWRPLGRSGDPGALAAAVAAANAGRLVVAGYAEPPVASDGRRVRRPGHVALLRPQPDASGPDGPLVMSAGEVNAALAPMRLAFAQHPAAWPDGIALFEHDTPLQTDAA